MRSSISILILTLIVGVTGCKNNTTSSATDSSSSTATTGTMAASSAASTSTLSPEQLGTLGAQIKKSPGDADRLLSAQGLNEQSFAAAVRKVSENPDDAKRYAAAYRSAG